MATTTVAPILIQQVNKTFYVGFGSLHDIQDAVDAAVASGHPSLVVIPQGYWGGDLISDVVNGTDWIYLTDQRGWNPFYYLWEDNQYRGPFINLSGSLTEDTTLDLNGNDLIFSGAGTTYIGGTDPTTATVIQNGGNLSAPNITTPNITADNGNFATALVDGSPVRTFENTGDPGTGATYPPAGIAVSNGTGWGTSIPTNTFLPVAGGTMTGMLTMNGPGQPVIRFNNPNAPTDAKLSEIRATEWSTQFSFITDDGNTTNFWLAANRSGASPAAITLNGELYMQGLMNVYGPLQSFGTLTSIGAGGVVWFNGDTTPVLNMTNYSGAQDSQTFQIVQWASQLVFRNVDGSGNGVPFLAVDRSGASVTNFWFEAPVNAPAKNFVIPHPTEDNKTLHHSCVEGPEHAVFYRGESKTKGSSVEITLPDYFEALTRKEGRTVQVTPLFESGYEFGCCAASRVIDGKFRVRSNEPDQPFYWEVKAIRADLEPLEVTRDRDRDAQTRQPSGKKKTKK